MNPPAPPAPNEEDTLQFFDEVIASCDSEPLRKPYRDDGNADVDVIGEFQASDGNQCAGNKHKMQLQNHPGML